MFAISETILIVKVNGEVKVMISITKKNKHLVQRGV